MAICQKHDIKFGWQGWQRSTYALLPSYVLCHRLDAFAQHVYRAHYQTMIWKSVLDSGPPEAADLTKYGWQEEDGKLAPVMLPQNAAALAPVEVLQMIKCGCTSTRPCSTARCKCIVAQMSCSVFYKCHAGADCNKEHTKTLVL